MTADELVQRLGLEVATCDEQGFSGFLDGLSWVGWYGGPTICLDGDFTLAQLERLVACLREQEDIERWKQPVAYLLCIAPACGAVATHGNHCEAHCVRQEPIQQGEQNR